jgi:hypothetical protein
MRHEVIQMEVKELLNGEGRPEVVERFHEKTLHIHGTFTATLQVQGVVGAHDEWTDIGSAISAPSIVAVPLAVTRLRIKTTAYTNGTPVAHLGGFDSRTD